MHWDYQIIHEAQALTDFHSKVNTIPIITKYICFNPQHISPRSSEAWNLFGQTVNLLQSNLMLRNFEFQGCHDPYITWLSKSPNSFLCWAAINVNIILRLLNLVVRGGKRIRVQSLCMQWNRRVRAPTDRQIYHR